MRLLGDVPDDGLAAGLTEEIASGLSRFRWISCVPGSIGAAAVRKPGLRRSDTDSCAAGRRGLCPGRHDPALRHAVADHLPADRPARRRRDRLGRRFDRDEADALGLQDEIGAAIVAQVDPELMRMRAGEPRRPPPRRPERAGSAAEGAAGDLSDGADGFLEARRLLELSRRADPAQFRRAWLAGPLGPALCRPGLGRGSAALRQRGRRLAERAVMLDPMDARA